MRMRIHWDDPACLAGISLADAAEPESGNMALHACQDAAAVVGNRERLAAALSLWLDDFVCAAQTHSLNARRATAADRGRGARDQATAIPDTDALYTTESGLVLCCFVADCVPLTFVTDDGALAGVVHSGWRGTVGEIAGRTFEHLFREENRDPSAFRVHIGPSIRRAAFEVGPEVAALFSRLGYADDAITVDPSTGRHHIDNALVVRRQCERAGIPAGRITVDPTCTFAGPETFSHRRDAAAGRHLCFISLRKR